MKKTFERLLSALLILVMLLGIVPGGVFAGTKAQAAITEGDVVVYDFKDFAVKSAADADLDPSHWWNLLRAGGITFKYI